MTNISSFTFDPVSPSPNWSVASFRKYAEKLREACEWMENALNLPFQNWHAISTSETFVNVLYSLPCPHETAILERLDELQDVKKTVEAAKTCVLAFLCRLLYPWEASNERLQISQSVDKVLNEFPLRHFARALFLLAPEKGTSFDQMFIAMLTKLIAEAVEFKDAIRDTIRYFVKNLRATDQLLGRSAALRPEAVYPLMTLLTEQLFSLRRLIECTKETGMRVEARSFMDCVPSLLDNIFKKLNDELLYNASIHLARNDVQHIFKARHFADKQAVKLYLLGLESLNSAVYGSTLAQHLARDRLIYLIDEEKPLQKLLARDDPQKEPVIEALATIRESQQIKLTQQIDRAGLIEDFGKLTHLLGPEAVAYENICQILPDLPPVFVSLALAHHGYDEEKTLGAILASELPVYLERLRGANIVSHGLPKTYPVIDSSLAEMTWPETSSSRSAVAPGPAGFTEETPKKGLFSLAPVKKADADEVKKEEPEAVNTDSEKIKKLQMALNRLKATTVEDASTSERLVSMSTSKKHFTPGGFKQSQADKSLLRPSYNKYMYETNTDDEEPLDEWRNEPLKKEEVTQTGHHNKYGTPGGEQQGNAGGAQGGHRGGGGHGGHGRGRGRGRPFPRR
ncbi:unnamed protein product, partial [Mesorhabditis spiculigera]